MSCAPSAGPNFSPSARRSRVPGTAPVIPRSSTARLFPRRVCGEVYPMPRTFLLLSAAALALTPAAAQQRARQLNPRDVAEAQRQHAPLVQELGGAETGPRAAYVESVGRRVSVFSGVANPGQALRFTTLNSAVENALSVPGGYVYVTRQL